MTKPKKTSESPILGEAPPPDPVEIEPGEAWSDAATATLAQMQPAERAKWLSLLNYARSADGARPTQKWLNTAKPLIESIGRERVTRIFADWFTIFPRPRNDKKTPSTEISPDPNLVIGEKNAAILKGLAWCCATLDDAPLARALGDTAAAAWKKIAWLGPRCPKVGSAALYALSAMPGTEPVAQLARLATQVKQPTGAKTIGKALTAVAKRTGQTLDDLAELTVPTFGLNSEGVYRHPIGDFIAEIRLTGSVDASLTWLRSEGKPSKTVPAAIKRDHADALKETQRTFKDLQKMLPAQRARIERLLTIERWLSFNDWRQRFLDHPLVSHLTTRLVWLFETEGKSATAISLAGQLVSSDDQPQPFSAETRVRLWHPILSDAPTVRAWREFLQRHQIVQPFKQAHREIYILTDAERNTATYSNRFAAHILRQHQFVALCQQRGWKTALQGAWDGGDQTPTLELPAWGLRAQFWTEVIGNLDDASSSGVARHINTDQVRFYALNQLNPLPLDQVPALAFSEVMRDVDLFVGVASVGNDPTWQDGGPQGHFQRYWQSYSFGELSATAQTRKAVLETLLPRLKIKDRTSLIDRFLVVRGNLRTYKIHLGSGNILMEPNDQYLCIVPNQSTRSKNDTPFLPFEGDETFSIILSKAFLLAADDKIADPTITRQIAQK